VVVKKYFVFCFIKMNASLFVLFVSIEEKIIIVILLFIRSRVLLFSAYYIKREKYMRVFLFFLFLFIVRIIIFIIAKNVFIVFIG